MIDDRDDKINASQETEGQEPDDNMEDYEGDEEFEEEDEQSEGSARRGRARNAEELIMGEIPDRAGRAHDLLRSKLKGKIQLNVTGSNRYFIDWSSAEIAVKKNFTGNADTTIEIEERDLMKVTTGGLNPQIGMLSEKIRISGNPEIAVYFFNLISRPF